MKKTKEETKVPIAKGSKDIIKRSLDDLFKKKKQEVKEVEATEKPAAEITEAKKAKLQKKLLKIQRKQAQEERRQEEGAGKRKVTADGYKVYSLEELNVGKGGDTADCPFDCDCCF